MHILFLILVGLAALAIVAIVGEKVFEPAKKALRAPSPYDGLECIPTFAAFVETPHGKYTIRTRPDEGSLWNDVHYTYLEARDLVVNRVLNTTLGAAAWIDVGSRMIRKEDIIGWGVEEGSVWGNPNEIPAPNEGPANFGDAFVDQETAPAPLAQSEFDQWVDSGTEPVG